MKHAPKYRPNTGFIIVNNDGNLWWGRRTMQNTWQFPQGGIDNNETPKQAMFRELYEECGLQAKDVIILGESKKWYFYNFPEGVSLIDTSYIGQKQKWFLLLLKDPNKEFILTNANEFDDWRWVSYWYPLRNIFSFKREVYRNVLKEFLPCLSNYLNNRINNYKK